MKAQIAWLRVFVKGAVIAGSTMSSPERVIGRAELLEKVWDLHVDPVSNTGEPE